MSEKGQGQRSTGNRNALPQKGAAGAASHSESNTMQNRSLNLATRLGLAFVLSAAWVFTALADPFPWEDAEIKTGELRLTDGTHLTYKSGSSLPGHYLEIAVVLEWTLADVPFEQQIIHEMANSRPRLVVKDNIVEVSLESFPIGAEAASTVAVCWRLSADRRLFIETPCPDQAR